MNKEVIFIFRRDLRLQDNTALYAALKESDIVYPIFIFDPAQVSNVNQYKSNNLVQYMVETLIELKKSLNGKLVFLHGNPIKVVEKLIKAKSNVGGVYFNCDYTPYAIKRDSEIKKICEKYNIVFKPYHDSMLNPPGIVMNGQGKPYRVFTAYYNVAHKNVVADPVGMRIVSKKVKAIGGSGIGDMIEKKPARFYGNKVNKTISIHGGRKVVDKMLKRVGAIAQVYSKTRDDPYMETSRLSAPLRFGVLSIRELYHIVKRYSEFVKQLYWRDYYYTICFFFPEVIGEAFNPKFDDIKWKANKNHLAAWKEGRTGFPIVDAGMRQLNQTGYLHNRVRMIVASFLIKDLHIDWREGEQYFAQVLTDYDIAINNGNWQWVAGTGASNMPFFRIFNPWEQARKHDPDALYIKQWIPELRSLPAAFIHSWYTKYEKYKDINYPPPIVNHDEQKRISLKIYEGAF